MIVFQLVWVLSLVSAATYECLTTHNGQDLKADLQKVCDDANADLANDVYGQTGHSAVEGRLLSRTDSVSHHLSNSEPTQPATAGTNGGLKSFMTRFHPNCLWWKGQFIHKYLFPVSDIMTVTKNETTGVTTRSFEPVPSWVKNYFFQFNGNNLFVPWTANVTGLMRDNNPQSFWSNWINGRLPEFSQAHDRFVYDLLKTSKCNFKTYQTLAEWKSNGPQFNNTEGCNFQLRHWNTICKGDASICSKNPSSSSTSSSSSSSSSNSYSKYSFGVYHPIFGKLARGKNKVPSSQGYDKWKNSAHLFSGSIKTWKDQAGYSNWESNSENPTWKWMGASDGTWSGTHDDGTTWNGASWGIIDALRKHKQTLVGKSKDIFYQDEACVTVKQSSSATSIIISTIFMFIMLF